LSQNRDLEASIRQTIRKRLRAASPQPKVHRTVQDHLNCPNCYPKFEKAMLDRGYRKPNLCPKCKTELKRDIIGDLYCPECRWRK